ncbi:MAG: VWA domain-containing protein [Bacteriovoracaceae bacterium]|nr:VWA domain-containing protein [Bacteriovoracaceae bacterium]
MRFADPWFFLLLGFIIPILFFSSSSGGRIRFSSLVILKQVTKGPGIHPRMILTFLRVVALILFIMSIARPQKGRVFSEVSSEGIDIVLALDTSGSMEALDFKMDGKRVNRLTIVKKVVTQFVKKRPADRLGLVVFGEEAYTQCPLTLDHGIVVDFLTKLEIGMAGMATAIGSAIGVSVNRIKELKAKSKIIILLTDGENTAGRILPTKAAEIAKTYGIKIYTIGVGTSGQAPFLEDTIFGRRLNYRRVILDEKTLTNVATITGGKYYRANDEDELARIYDEIDKLETREVKVKQYTQYNELFHWFLIPALMILLLEILLANTRLRKIP